MSAERITKYKEMKHTKCVPPPPPPYKLPTRSRDFKVVDLPKNRNARRLATRLEQVSMKVRKMLKLKSEDSKGGHTSS